MAKLKNILMWIALAAIGLLIVLSIIGAFYGAEKARLFFNSIPLAIYWPGLAVLLIAGIVTIPRLLKNPSQLMMHLGGVLILAGSMWGSQQGHLLDKRLFGKEKIPNGYMLISRGSTDKNVTSEDFNKKIGELPFSIKLRDFRIEYYPQEKNIAPELNIKTADERNLRLAAKPGEEISLGPGQIKLKVIKTYKNFKIRTEDNKKIITDNELEGKNPAIEVAIETPDGNSHSRYVFEQFGDLSPGENGVHLSYKSRMSRTIQNYCSDVTIIENGKEILNKTIKVNEPLHYGGYHFNQDSYDAQMQTYTILSVASDNGLYIVYAGFWVLCIGMFRQFWVIRIKEFIK
jgi:hypothetical protein